MTKTCVFSWYIHIWAAYKLNVQKWKQKFTNIMKYGKSLSVFKNKLQNWKRKIKQKILSLFEELSSLFTIFSDNKSLL